MPSSPVCAEDVAVVPATEQYTIYDGGNETREIKRNEERWIGTMGGGLAKSEMKQIGTMRDAEKEKKKKNAQ